MSEKPSTAFGVSLIGAVWTLFAAIQAVNNFLLFLLALIPSLIILVSSVFLYAKPQLHIQLAGVVLAFSLATFFAFVVFLLPPPGAPVDIILPLVLFFIGPVLAAGGGLLGLVWRPPRVKG